MNKLPPGIWDNPKPEEMEAYNAFVLAWTGETISAQSIGYDVGYGVGYDIGYLPNDCNCTCPCNCFVMEVGGGLVVGGDPDVASTSIDNSGGLVVGGGVQPCQSSIVYEDLAVWMLNEDGSPYADRSVQSLHGTATVPPDQTAGIYCQWGQHFDGTQFIDLPNDNVISRFAVSTFITIETRYKQRQWFSRKDVFAFGHSAINTLWARVWVDPDLPPVSCFGSTRLEQDVWYHVACEYDGSTLKVYLNGELDGSVDVSGDLIDYTGPNHIARYSNGSSPVGMMQEVRLHNTSRSASWYRAERDNFCTGFYNVGLVEEPIFN